MDELTYELRLLTDATVNIHAELREIRMLLARHMIGPPPDASTEVD